LGVGSLTPQIGSQAGAPPQVRVPVSTHIASHGCAALDLHVPITRGVGDMQFKEALRAAGLARPGRTTWSGIASDGVPVFTIWSNEIRKVDGRYFAWWDHTGRRSPDGELMPNRKSRARTFVERAASNLGTPCRAVIIHPRMTVEGNKGVDSAIYPHPAFGCVVFRSADVDALQFIAELVPSA
jgi:hypothetical protein